MAGPVLITGAGGKLGQALARAYGERGVALARAALDIADDAAVFAALDQYRPSVVMNAAAASHVDHCETDPAFAARVNAIGPDILARACAARSIPIVHVSTDYVYGGDGLARARREEDPPSPLNVYGQSKLAGERAVMAAGGRSVTVRTSWLFDFPGCFLDRMLAKAQSGARLVLTDQVSTPTPVDALAQALALIAQALVDGKMLPSLLHVAGAPSATRTQWVQEALAVMETPVAVACVPLSDVGDAVARPVFTPLDTTLFTNLFGRTLDWKDAARACAIRRLRAP